MRFFQPLIMLHFSRTVALVLLKSESSIPPAPETVNLTKSIPSALEDDIAFIAKVFPVTEFQGDSIQVSLRVYKENRRRKREAIEVPVLTPGATYRVSQLNTDESGVRWERKDAPKVFLETFLIKIYVFSLEM